MKRRLSDFYKPQQKRSAEKKEVDGLMAVVVSFFGKDVAWEVVSYCRDERFGIMLHWGLYSVPGYDDVASAQRRRIQNGSEWYLKRLIDRGDSVANGAWPTSGWRETQDYHLKQYGNHVKYQDFAQQFTAQHWDPEQWIKKFSEAGASYVVITTKHHDGFCLWPSKTTSSNISLTPASKTFPDPIKTLSICAKKYGLKFGLYYSWGEFLITKSDNYQNYLSNVMKAQIEELLEYEPDLFWFDGDWMVTNLAGGQAAIDECLKIIQQQLPCVEINDRVGHKSARKDPNWLGSGVSFRVYEDRAIPAKKPAIKWQHCNTIGLSWGYNRQQLQSHYKTRDQIRQLRKRVQLLGGDFLINLGPTPHGQLHPLELAALQ